MNVADIAKIFEQGAVVSPDSLKKKGLIHSTKNKVKILGNGEIGISINVKDCAVSKAAAEKILAAKGSIQA